MLHSGCCHLLTIPTAAQHHHPASPQSGTQILFLWQFFFLTLPQLWIHHAFFSSFFFFSHKIRSQICSTQTQKYLFINIVQIMSSHFLIYFNSFLLHLEYKTKFFVRSLILLAIWPQPVSPTLYYVILFYLFVFLGELKIISLLRNLFIYRVLRVLYLIFNLQFIVYVSCVCVCVCAKLLQPLLTLYDPIDGSPSGSSVHRIL